MYLIAEVPTTTVVTLDTLTDKRRTVGSKMEVKKSERGVSELLQETCMIL